MGHVKTVVHSLEHKKMAKNATLISALRHKSCLKMVNVNIVQPIQLQAMMGDFVLQFNVERHLN